MANQVKVIVVGSGASGVQAASRLLERGLCVQMLDYGECSSYAKESLPRESFAHVRKNDLDQFHYFLGKNYEGIMSEDIKSGNKLSPLMKHVIACREKLSPVSSESFIMNQSLARGGLAQAWGAGAVPLREIDFKQYPFGLDALTPYYDELAKRIGISGDEDDLAEELFKSSWMQPALKMDTVCKEIFETYRRSRSRFSDSGFLMGRAWMAICSEPMPDRDGCGYLDMEFWGDADRAVYRPEWTLQELEKDPGFTYVGNINVLKFEQSNVKNEVIVSAKSTISNHHTSFQGDGLVLAAGVPGSAKIALESSGRYGPENSMPIRTNAYTYVPCIYPALIGAPKEDKRSSLAQLSAIFHPDSDPSHAIFSSFFSYRSMLIFKLLKEVELPYNFGLELFRRIHQDMVIVTIFHEDNGDGDKKLWLEQPANNSYESPMKIVYNESSSNYERQNRTEKQFLKQIRKLGLIPLKRIRRKAGSSIHYSGTMPHTANDKILTCDPEGRLKPYDKIWVVDGSTLVTMPAMLPTYTIMANALRIADKVADKLL